MFDNLKYEFRKIKDWPRDRVLNEASLWREVARLQASIASIRGAVDQMEADLYNANEEEPEPYKPRRSNGEILRTMSDDALADYFRDWAMCSRCPARNLTCKNHPDNCPAAWKEWLKRVGR